MEEDEKIEIDKAKVVTSTDLLDAYQQNGHVKNGHATTANPPYEPPSRRTVTTFSAIVALLIITPFVLTFIGAITGPSHQAHIPTGRLLFLTGDQPSEHTATLRGLFVVDSTGNMRQLAHDTEPQDTDSGSRSWIDEPEVSPDGRYVAYLQDQIVLQEEIQSDSQQLCVFSLNSGENVQPTSLDLTKLGYKRVVGLAWSTDSQKINLFQDDKIVQVNPAQIDAAKQSITPPPVQLPIPGLPILEPDKYISSLSYPAITAAGALYFTAKTPHGPELVGSLKPVILNSGSVAPTNWPVRVAGVAGYGLSPDATEIALVPQGRSHDITIIDTATGNTRQVVHARWGWSVFGGRQITSVGFSPDARYLMYTVSKPPVPEEEMFVVNLATGDIHLLPYRSGRASWTWVR